MRFISILFVFLSIRIIAKKKKKKKSRLASRIFFLINIFFNLVLFVLDLFLTNQEAHHCFWSSSFLYLFCCELRDDSFLYLTTVSHYWPHSVTSSTTSLTVSNHFHLRCARSAPPCLFLDAPCSCHA